ncbi:hypothetical protein [Pediococcus pentosaceus]|uniref:hypothetical protein n=1 Tax=Pediococcus pentosaceus TaxID=1255 RepID=UPI0021A6741B|nr:hypothetical protein [Pediococcus pentosaceus]MCT3033280.1 hypothetical protein [Pediococcus pentosaceus]
MIELGEYSDAITYAQKGLAFENERKTIYRSAEILFVIGEVYYLEKKFELAEQYYIKSMYLAYSTDSEHFLPLLLNSLKPKKHLKLLQTNIEMLDKLFKQFYFLTGMNSLVVHRVITILE